MRFCWSDFFNVFNVRTKPDDVIGIRIRIVMRPSHAINFISMTSIKFNELPRSRAGAVSDVNRRA